MSDKQVSVWALQVYRRLAGAFPEEFLRVHGEEMDLLTEDIIREVAARGGMAGLIPTIPRILADVALRLPIEYSVELGQNLKYGARMLAKSPGATLASVISLGIGIGMTTSVYSEMESFILRDVPHVVEPGKVVLRSESDPIR